MKAFDLHRMAFDKVPFDFLGEVALRRWYDLYILTIALVGYSRGGHYAFGKYCSLHRAGCT